MQALRSGADAGSASAAAADARERGLRSRLLSLQQQVEEQDGELERLQVRVCFVCTCVFSSMHPADGAPGCEEAAR